MAFFVLKNVFPSFFSQKMTNFALANKKQQV